jgi:hypothetical protein
VGVAPPPPPLQQAKTENYLTIERTQMTQGSGNLQSIYSLVYEQNQQRKQLSAQVTRTYEVNLNRAHK